MKISNLKPAYIIVSLFIFFTLTTIWVSAINTEDTGYRVTIGGYSNGINIAVHGECERIENNGTKDIFVPTKTELEWQAFIEQVGESNTVGIQNVLGGACCYMQSYYICELGDIYWYNSCDVREGIKETCPENCTGTACCIPETSSDCYNGDVYWYNSCDTRGSQKTDCEGAGCSGGICCTSNVSSSCSGDDVYWYSSCDIRQSIKDNCSTCGCIGDTCVAPGNDIYRTCIGYDVVKKDSCGNTVEEIATCECGCTSGGCVTCPCFGIDASSCADCGGYWNQYPPPSTGGMCITVH